MNPARYFDNAATTPLDPRVREAMLPWLGESFGNPHSIHAFGRAAREAVESARAEAARLIGAEDPQEIAFTSGATEAANWALRGAADLWVSPFEHDAVRQAEPSARILANDGWELAPAGAMTAVMAVSNETGGMPEPGFQPDFIDASQAAGKTGWTVGGARFACLSAHKLHGPMGVGALYAQGGLFPEPLMRGGGQEGGFRSGTLNVPAIVGFGEACRIAAEEQPEDEERAWTCRQALIHDGLGAACQAIDAPRQSPFIACLAFEGVEGEALVVEMDAAGFAIGSGPACSAGEGRPSRTLEALGLPPEAIRGAVRVSLGRFSRPAEAEALGRELVQAASRLRDMRR